ncbi:MAG: ABC transporter permease, partial [Bifidobacteriaceae bacterium]|nr:ABC transporter permease [Bifidobacteriaceae bacterium]
MSASDAVPPARPARPARPAARARRAAQAGRYAARRVGELAAVLLVLTAVTFGLTYLAGGDPARSLVGARKATPELLAQIRSAHHLDDPVWEQYGRWLWDLIHGDLGASVRTGLPVSQMVASRAGLTLELTLFALVMALAAGVPLGVWAARRHGTALDRAVTGLAVAGLSAPSFAVGLLALYVLAVLAGWFPVYGAGAGGLADRLWHLVLPAATLALGLVASLVKITRAALLREINADHTAFARSRGARPAALAAAQLRGAALPVLTATGLLLASLVSGTVLVEVT